MHGNKNGCVNLELWFTRLLVMYYLGETFLKGIYSHSQECHPGADRDLKTTYSVLLLSTQPFPQATFNMNETCKDLSFLGGCHVRLLI